jgi:hypothetical protein
MNLRKINWLLWAALLLCLLTLFSFPIFFVRFPLTRDFPWANIALGVIALVLLIAGVRRAFGAGRSRWSKTAGVVVSLLGVLFLTSFALLFFVEGRALPPAKGAPQVGQKAPDFTLADSTGRQTSSAELLSAQINGKPVKGMLLIFYRGYW